MKRIFLLDGKDIQVIRKALGHTQTEFGEKLGAHRGKLHRIEKNKTLVSQRFNNMIINLVLKEGSREHLELLIKIFAE